MLLIGCLEKLTPEEFEGLSKQNVDLLREFPSRVFSTGMK